ncbi:ornithine cyclodeaminase family protein [Streptomyces sp. H27-H5]|uniref:ornithine cyclodeaminase family protein n=1 Tax=Streptomyces sp. H27-H5 TaxID=2996460 RepID=UPI0022706950|nr:ornithine cyclodeaminase family protein [Streptomyces sp. H27-H5]MCY0960580.1 ornithine cyclodeaminase family protein [Streptomyces sp. H27-H5]
MTALLTPAAAADALADALRAGLDPETCPHRTALPVPGGELLLMPAAFGGYAGVKIAGVAPGNPARGLPRITGSYLLLDGPTLRPLALFDGAALTALRTPAVSALALRYLAPGDRPARMVLFGWGPQAYGHLEAVLAEREVADVVVVARDPAGAARLAAHARALGAAARTGTASAVAEADLIVCCTTARAPLFDGRLVAPGATVVAVGSHEPDARETDSALVRRAVVYVEARAAALREAGDLLIPEAEGLLGPGHVAGTLADLVAGRVPPPGRADSPRLFKSVGMAWEDLAVAAALFRAAGGSGAT